MTERLQSDGGRFVQSDGGRFETQDPSGPGGTWETIRFILNVSVFHSTITGSVSVCCGLGGGFSIPIQSRTLISDAGFAVISFANSPGHRMRGLTSGTDFHTLEFASGHPCTPFGGTPANQQCPRSILRPYELFGGGPAADPGYTYGGGSQVTIPNIFLFSDGETIEVLRFTP